MEVLAGRLRRVEDGLRALGRTALLDALQPGLPSSRVQGLLAESGLPLSAEIEALYRWRKGTALDRAVLDDVHLVPGFCFCALQEASTNHRAFVVDERWRSGLLPILADGGGDFLAADLMDPRVAPVHHVRIEESEQSTEFASISDMLETFARAFELGSTS